MKISNNFVIRKIAGDIIVVPIGGMAKEYNGLIAINEVSEFIWRLLEEGKNEGEIVEAVLQEFEGATKEQVEKDVTEFIELLVKHKVLE